MKYTLIAVLAVLAFIFTSCDQDNPVSPASNNALSSIQGNLKNWSYGSDMKIVMTDYSGYWTNENQLYSQSSIGQNGNFVLSKLAVPSIDKLLNPPYYQFVNEAVISNNTVRCSDSSARIAYSRFQIIQQGDSTRRTRGEVHFRNYDYNFLLWGDSVKTNAFYTDFIYVNKNVEVKGSVEVSYYNAQYKERRITKYTYYLSYKKGWNKCVVYTLPKKVTQTPDLTIYESEVTLTNSERFTGWWDLHYY